MQAKLGSGWRAWTWRGNLFQFNLYLVLGNANQHLAANDYKAAEARAVEASPKGPDVPNGGYNDSDVPTSVYNDSDAPATIYDGSDSDLEETAACSCHA